MKPNASISTLLILAVIIMLLCAYIVDHRMGKMENSPVKKSLITDPDAQYREQRSKRYQVMRSISHGIVEIKDKPKEPINK